MQREGLTEEVLTNLLKEAEKAHAEYEYGLCLRAIVYGLISSNRLGLGHPVVLGALALGILTLIAFLLWEARSRTPLMPLTLFRSSTFSGANGFTFLLYAAVGGFTFFFPFDLIQVQGYSP